MTDSWSHLRDFTAARVALGRAGGSLLTAPLLDFRLAHARARDAVLTPFDPEALAAKIRQLHLEVFVTESQAAERSTYLQRPDLGRKLSEPSRALLEKAAPPAAPDLAIIVSDGLSTLAAMTQVTPLLHELLPLLSGWTLAPIVVVRHGRVAVQDEVGALFSAQLSLIVLGERPGLGSPDSLGAYFTYAPVPGRTDAERNCVSNIRPQGLTPSAAARKLHALLHASRTLKLSGVRLKDDTPLPSSPEVGVPQIR